MRQRFPFKMPSRGRGWTGENNIDSQIEQEFSVGALTKCRNYHIVGRGRLLKRQGWQRYVATQVNGTSPVQGLAFYDFEGSRFLVAQAGGGLAYKNGAAWTSIVGSLTLGSTLNILPRFTFFHDGTNGNLVSANNVNNPWYWTGSGAALPLPLTLAADVATFKQHLFAINTAARSTAVQFSATGVLTSFPDNNVFDCTRNSAGVALSEHNAETLLAFYEKSVHRINFNYGNAGALSNLFTTQLVDGSHGCRSRTSVATYKGKTYFASDDGIYEIGDPAYPAKYISRAIENLWGTLKRSRLPYMSAVVRSEPWNEIVWLCTSQDGTEHDMALVFNPVIAQMYGEGAGWTVFQSLAGALKFNCGTNFIDSDGVHRTVLGETSGYVDEAWGTTQNPVQNTDGPTLERVATIFETGMIDCGYDGIKGAREIWVDLELFDDRTFGIYVDSANGAPLKNTTAVIGADADILGVDFMLGESYLAGGGISSFYRPLSGSGRYFRVQLTENDDGLPHYLNAIHLLFVRKGLRES